MMAIVLIAAEFTGQGPNIDQRAQQQAFPTASVANSQRAGDGVCSRCMRPASVMSPALSPRIAGYVFWNVVELAGYVSCGVVCA